METTFPTMDRHEFFRLLGTGLGALLLTQCSGESNPDTIAQPGIDFTLNLDDQVNANLKTKGGYIITSNNILVAHTNDGKFLAVSARCTHTEGRSLLVYQPASNQFYCPQDLSRFDATGKVITGPAKQALKQYTVSSMNGATVRVFGQP